MVADAALPDVEVSEHLRAACEVVRMLAAIEDVIVELLVVYVRERECEHSLYGDIKRCAVARQLQAAQALTIAHCLRCTLLLKHTVYCCAVSAEHLATLTVDVV